MTQIVAIRNGLFSQINWHDRASIFSDFPPWVALTSLPTIKSEIFPIWKISSNGIFWMGAHVHPSAGSGYWNSLWASKPKDPLFGCWWETAYQSCLESLKTSGMFIIWGPTQLFKRRRNILISDLVIVDTDYYQLSPISPPGTHLISIIWTERFFVSITVQSKHTLQICGDLTWHCSQDLGISLLSVRLLIL